MSTEGFAETLPQKIDAFDQYGQLYQLTDRNKLWPDALARYLAGEERICYPLDQLTDALEWGWWSCFRTQGEWVAGCGVPMPDHQLLYGLADANDHALRELLQTFGGYVSWLEAQVGVMEGRLHALKAGYAAAILVTSADLKDKGTEKSKEAQLLARSETLRQTKRMQIEQETVLATAKGMLEAYQRAYDTVSRVISVRIAEHEVATGRHA